VSSNENATTFVWPQFTCICYHAVVNVFIYALLFVMSTIVGRSSFMEIGEFFLRITPVHPVKVSTPMSLL
jgi:hypothetical protein